MISKLTFFSPFWRDDVSVLCSPFISCVKWSSNETAAEFQSTLVYRSVRMDLFVEEMLLYQSGFKCKKWKEVEQAAPTVTLGMSWSWIQGKERCKTIGIACTQPICLQKLLKSADPGDVVCWGSLPVLTSCSTSVKGRFPGWVGMCSFSGFSVSWWRSKKGE